MADRDTKKPHIGWTLDEWERGELQDHDNPTTSASRAASPSLTPRPAKMSERDFENTGMLEPDRLDEKQLRIVATSAIEIIRECRATLGLEKGQLLTEAVKTMTVDHESKEFHDEILRAWLAQCSCGWMTEYRYDEPHQAAYAASQHESRPWSKEKPDV